MYTHNTECNEQNICMTYHNNDAIIEHMARTVVQYMMMLTRKLGLSQART